MQPFVEEMKRLFVLVRLLSAALLALATPGLIGGLTVGNSAGVAVIAGLAPSGRVAHSRRGRRLKSGAEMPNPERRP
jgi:hypothetical protein